MKLEEFEKRTELFCKGKRLTMGIPFYYSEDKNKNIVIDFESMENLFKEYLDDVKDIFGLK